MDEFKEKINDITYCKLTHEECDDWDSCYSCGVKALFVSYG